MARPIVLVACVALGAPSSCAASPASPVVESPAVVAVPAQAEPAEPKVVDVADDDVVDASGAGAFDERDGKTYRVVSLAGRLWFAQNLAFAAPGSWCYEERASNCSEFGRLYHWESAMRACPRGWRLPSEEEWQSLEDLSPGSLQQLMPGGKTGFDILLGGERRTDGRYQDIGQHFYFWTSTTLEGRARLRWNLTDSALQIATDVTTEAYSVRCVRDL